MSIRQELGKVSVTPKGTWVTGGAYAVLDIVSKDGASYIARRNVPSGTPLTDYSYWMEIAGAGPQGPVGPVGPQPTLVNSLEDDSLDKAPTANLTNELNEKVNKISIQVYASGGDDTANINAALQEVFDNGGGTVYLPDSEYNYSGDIHVLEGAELTSTDDTRLNCTVLSGARFISYNDTSVNKIKLMIPEDYNDDVFLFSNRYLASVNRKNKFGENVNANVENVSIYTTFNASTTNKVAFKQYANRSDLAQATQAGYWGLNVKNCYVRQFNKVVVQKTDNTGWLNGNLFENVTCDSFVNAVVVEKSANSLGIDHNKFVLNLQSSPITQDIFIDGVSSNIYTGCTFWDMKSYTDARVGTGVVTNSAQATLLKERYARFLLTKRYHILGRFTAFNTSVNHVAISLNSNNNYHTVYHIRGGASGGVVEKRQYGTNRLDDGVKFFTRTLSNGETELYIYNDLNTEIEANVFFESTRSFYISPMTYYDDISGAVELTAKENYYAKSDYGEFRTDTTISSPLSDYRVGETRQFLSTSANNPNGKPGILTTVKHSNTASYGGSYQEFVVFNSPYGEKYKRHASTASVWGNFYLDCANIQLTTAQRNAFPTALLIRGSQVYDTTLEKPVWWNGTVWKDSNGTEL